MKFNFHAVGKKDRIKKTLLFCTPASIAVGLVGAFLLMIVMQINSSLLYYAFILGIGYVVGTMVRKIGRGTTVEFLVIAGILATISILMTMYFFYVFQGFAPSLMQFITQDLLNFANFRGSFTIIEVFLGAIVAVSQANTVQIR